MIIQSEDSPVIRSKYGSKLAVQPQRIDELNRQYFNVLTQISPRKRLAYIQSGHVGETEIIARSIEQAERITGEQIIFKNEDEVDQSVEIRLSGRVLIQQPFHVDELRQRACDRPFGESPVGFLKVRGEHDHHIKQRFGYDIIRRGRSGKNLKQVRV